VSEKLVAKINDFTGTLILSLDYSILPILSLVLKAR
jgi:hypothetical protein